MAASVSYMYNLSRRCSLQFDHQRCHNKQRVTSGFLISAALLITYYRAVGELDVVYFFFCFVHAKKYMCFLTA